MSMIKFNSFSDILWHIVFTKQNELQKFDNGYQHRARNSGFLFAEN